MAHFFGDQFSLPIAIATITVELVGSALLVAGRLQWLAAGALAVFTAAATFVAHDFWNVTDTAAHFREFNTFLEHIGLIAAWRSPLRSASKIRDDHRRQV